MANHGKRQLNCFSEVDLIKWIYAGERTNGVVCDLKLARKKTGQLRQHLRCLQRPLQKPAAFGASERPIPKSPRPHERAPSA